MTSDINITAATVVAIQGESISTITPTDGYVLTWSTGDGYWTPKPILTTGLRKEYFTNSGTWICPVGITNILVIGTGGGGGGAGGSYYSLPGGGGGASIQQTQYVSVSPGISYTVTIGAGGSGGTAGTVGVDPIIGTDGGATTLVNGGVNYFYTLGGGKAGFDGASGNNGISGPPFTNSIGWATISGTQIALIPGCGGYGSVAQGNGMKNSIGGYVGGTLGSSGGGGGGGAGPQGAGGNGGNGSTGSAAGNGSTASNNTGAGGGGGGMGNWTGNNGGAGGVGGSGYLYIIY